jgi:hypothetical protein
VLRAFALLAMLALASAWSPVRARADGDPASDVLATQALFLPQDAAVPSRQAAQLDELLQETARGGYPIRVAVIATAADLGSITELWNQPQSYAEFLGEELSLVYRGPLIVVMPSGVGLYNVGGAAAAHRGVLGGATPRAAIGAAALADVRSLAAAAGHPLAEPASGPAISNASASSPTPWIALVIGAILVVLAWAASLRARPLRLAGRRTSSA